VAKRFDPTQGKFWVGGTISGQHGVFWTHADWPDWHRLMGSFASRERAEEYMVQQAQGLQPGLAPPDLIEAPPDIEVETLPVDGKPRTKRENEMLLGLRILAKLPEMYRRNPNGITSEIIMREFDVAYGIAMAAAACRWLERSGRAQWASRGGDPKMGAPRKALFPNGADVPPQGLSFKQAAVLTVLLDAADANGVVTEHSFRDIALRVGASIATVNAALYELSRKGYVSRLKVGRNGIDTTEYRVRPKPGKTKWFMSNGLSHEHGADEDKPG
jgi:hypothetical protein